MAEEQKPVEPKGSPKMVPVSDLMRVKKSAAETEKKLRAELAEYQERIGKLEADVDLVSGDVSDDDVYKQRRGELLTVARKVAEDRTNLNKKMADVTERERRAQARELVAEYKAKGVELDFDSLVMEENPEAAAMSVYVAHLESPPVEPEKTEEKKEEAPATPQVFESVQAGAMRKMPHDMVKPDGTPDPEALAEFRRAHMKT